MTTDVERESGPGSARAGLIAVVAVIATLTLFNILSAVHQSGWLPHGDMKNLSAMVVSSEHPQGFVNDPVFSDAKRFSFYTPTFMAMLRGFYRASGGFDLFEKVTSAVMLPIHLIGFYLLGVVLTRNRWAGLALALLSGSCFLLPRNDYMGWWGFQYMLPRTFFLALAPYPFWLALRFRERYGAWIAAMAIIGLLSYVHPVSAPAMAAGLWFMWLAYQPRQWSRGKRVLAAAVLGVVFVAVLAPYAIWYKTHAELGGKLPAGMTRQDAIAMIEYRVPGAFDVAGALKETVKRWTELPLLPVLVLGAAGLVACMASPERRLTAKAMVLWVVGIWAASFIVPLLEWKLSEAMGGLPSEISMVRGMRYFAIPIFALAVLLPVAVGELSWGMSRLAGKTLRAGGWVCVGLGVGWMLLSCPPMADVGLQEAEALLKCRLVATPPAEESALAEALKAIADRTPATALFMCEDEEAACAIRSVAHRGLAHCRKDGSLLVNGDLAGLKKWMEREKRWQEAVSRANKEGMAAVYEGAKGLGAEYVLVGPSEGYDARPEGVSPKPMEVIFQNDYWRVIKLGAGD